ncbi:hypothetical protein SAMN05192544_104028 [Paraburkholderia hospita]|jgi:hypothetical protein|nr:hypothetical protein SAMN05192544_104028 [Paraburkholderia hospita]
MISPTISNMGFRPTLRTLRRCVFVPIAAIAATRNPHDKLAPNSAAPWGSSLALPYIATSTV